MSEIKIAGSKKIITGCSNNASISFELVNDPFITKFKSENIFNLSINVCSKTETDVMTTITLCDVNVVDIKTLAEELNKLASELESYLGNK